MGGFMNVHSNYSNDSYRQPPLSTLNASIRLLMGLALSVGGSCVILMVLLKVKEAYDNPELLKVFLALVPEEPKLRTVIYNNQEIILPLASFHYFSYGICIMLFMVAGMLGGSLLKRGIYLLVP